MLGFVNQLKERCPCLVEALGGVIITAFGGHCIQFFQGHPRREMAFHVRLILDKAGTFQFSNGSA